MPQVGDGELHRPWSKYSEGSSAYVRSTKKTKPADSIDSKGKPEKSKVVSKEQELLQKIKTDPEMRAFVEAMKPRSKGKIWENDDGLQAAQPAVVKQVLVKSKKTGGDGVLLTRTHVKFDGSDEESDGEYEDAPAAADDDGVAEAAPAAADASVAFDSNMDDLAYLRAKKTEWKVAPPIPHAPHPGSTLRRAHCRTRPRAARGRNPRDSALRQPTRAAPPTGL